MKLQKFYIFILMALFLSGCSTIAIDTGETAKGKSYSSDLPLSVAPNLRLEDIPVPEGFQFIANESFVFQNEQVRVGLLKYRGVAAPQQVLKFYKDQMPLYQWDLINIVEHEARTMNFEKVSQSCTVAIEGVEGEEAETTVIISTAPKSSTAK